jgi:DNA polymerase (family 10)
MPKNNVKLAEIFNEMAEILEIQGVDWKPRAYRQAARSIEALGEDVSTVYRKGGLKALEGIPGVGENIARKIAEFLDTGKVQAHQRLRDTIPSHINMLLRIPGMGPKTVRKLEERLKIRSVEDLEKAALSHKIAAIPGFGEESEKDILENITLMRGARGRVPLKEAEKEARKIIARLKKLKEVIQISAAGSLRRKRPTVGDIDILVASRDPQKVIGAFTKIKGVKKVLAGGGTKASIVLASGIQSDLRVLPPESWGAGLLYFTGSKQYNIELRRIAIKKGYKLSEYGLFDRKTGKMVAGRTEQEVCRKLGVKWLGPEERER